MNPDDIARIRANACATRDCERERAPNAIVCRDCLLLLWHNKLDRMPDGSYVVRRSFAARDETGRMTA